MQEIFFCVLVLLFIMSHMVAQSKVKERNNFFSYLELLLPELSLFFLSLYFETYQFFLEAMMGFNLFFLLIITVLDIFYYKRKFYSNIPRSILPMNAILLYLFVAIATTLDYPKGSSYLPISVPTMLSFLSLFMILLFRKKREKKRGKVMMLEILNLFLLFFFPLLLLWYQNSFLKISSSFFLGMILALPHMFYLHDTISNQKYEEEYEYFILLWIIHFVLIGVMDLFSKVPIYFYGTSFLSRFCRFGIYSLLVISFQIFYKKAKGIFYVLPSILILVGYFLLLILN